MISIKNRLRIVVYSVLLFFVALQAREAYYQHIGTNGFDLINPLVPKEAILQGGPPKDGIPSIDNPKFLKSAQVKQNGQIKDDDRVLGIYHNGIAKAYPIAIMNWHEIVNDEFDGEMISITFCPLCGTGMAFETDDIGKLGVSGLLYNSDMLLYDRKTESLWSQVMETAISGRFKGDKLRSIPMTYTTWKGWHSAYPESLLLSRDTGYSRDYDSSPYIGYPTSNVQYFPTANSDNRYRKKEPVIGLKVGSHTKVWPLVELRQSSLPIQDNVGGQAITINYDELTDRAWITNSHNELMATVRGFWFAWIAFYPDTEVYQFRKP